MQEVKFSQICKTHLKSKEQILQVGGSQVYKHPRRHKTRQSKLTMLLMYVARIV